MKRVLQLAVTAFLLSLAGCGGEDEPAGTAEDLRSLTIDLGNGVSMELVRIEAGTFLMGSDTGNPAEQPVHQVTITKPFYMGKYEVTQEQWESVMGSNPSDVKQAKMPVELVSWNDCQLFIQQLNNLAINNQQLEGIQFRLPTEAQWEYACRTGLDTKFCYGDDEAVLPEYAWYAGNSGPGMHAVGERQPNAWGIYDMHGNVWEWCSDRYGTYGSAAETDPEGPAEGYKRVVRGGSWCDWANYLRSASRFIGVGPDVRNHVLGVRVMVEVP